MGFWHVGYMEFHDPLDLEGYELRPKVYHCDQCALHFPTIDKLKAHCFEAHPYKRPVLFIAGKPIPKSGRVIRSALAEAEIFAQDATACAIDGKVVSLANIGKKLSKISDGVVEIELSNAQSAGRYRLDFQVASPEQMRAVEDAFQALTETGELTIDSLREFGEQCQSLGPAVTYGDGVASYLYGVLAKERTGGVDLDYGEYKERFLRADEALAEFDRPLSRMIRALVAFHFNHFSVAVATAPPGALLLVANAFSGLLQSDPWHLDSLDDLAETTKLEHALTDSTTRMALKIAMQGIRQLRQNVDDINAGIKTLRAGDQDRSKFLLMKGEALAARDDQASKDEAKKVARQLAGFDTFREWAKSLEEKLSV